jgi:hypothetical protein
MLNRLQELNEEILKRNLHNKKEYDKHLLIRKLLQDKNCFQKLTIEQAYAVLRDLYIEEQNLKQIYMSLI